MSTAKSMATLYLSGKRNAAKTSTLGSNRFKSSTSNLYSSRLTPSGQQQANSTRLKSTSMTNLIAGDHQDHQQQHSQHQTGSRIQRPASRNALDSIHNGMNAKYAQVQSKVYLQNIRPQPQGSSSSSSKIPGSKSNTLGHDVTTKRVVGSKLQATNKVTSDRTALLNKLKTLQEDLDRQELERENLRHELEREKSDKAEQIQQLKQELQEKIAEHDKQNEEYHQKLLEAYELADQNRRAADTVLSESRLRDEETRKKTEELETQLAELKEFVAMKEEMTGKMYELREQIREERERYEEQLKSLHQLFENEKISCHLEAGQQQQISSNNKLDHNSNYFNRIKPTLQSTESINKFQSKCRQCQSGSSQLHRSEHDIYGSKMSTRMQDTARSAWKASKQFASSVITGGVSLSACRQCTKRTTSASGSPTTGSNSAGVIGSQSPSNHYHHQAQRAVDQLPAIGSVVSGGFNSGCASPDELADADQHTSVIKVGSVKLDGATGEHQLQQSGAQPKIFVCSQQQQQKEDSSLIRVDENNKLTIVTKFNDSDCHGPSSSIEMAPASSSGSERSRCESSSSGRGTSSDAGSAASQNGDEEGHTTTPHTVVSNNNNKTEISTLQANAERPVKQRHGKRKSSLFKASKVFSGSQVSLNKLKYFFTGKAATNGQQHQQQQQQQYSANERAAEHLESSRLRCMELNQAINVASIGPQSSAGVGAKSTSPDMSIEDKVNSAAIEVGQGGGFIGDNVVQNQQQQSSAVDPPSVG